VLEDAELEKTIDWAVFGRHWNAGQVCVSSKRMILVEAIRGLRSNHAKNHVKKATF
jgi:acyl-CoA reductase-like NAD-dependent aldehyde dehydrogenase